MLPSSLQQSTGVPKVKATPEKLRKTLDLLGMKHFRNSMNVKLIETVKMESWQITHLYKCHGKSWLFVLKYNLFTPPSLIYA